MAANPGATLRITGPVSDGFWVRALVVMSQTAWARRLGLPVSISYRSQYDAYLDSHDERRDGWTQFFEPLKRNLTGGERKRLLSNPIGHANILGKLVQLDCLAAARAWEAYSNYAPNYRAASMQRKLRTELVRSLPVEPRRVFHQAADTFWRESGLGHAANNGTVLGVHLRGTDKQGGIQRGARPFLPLIRAYLCHWPTAFVFVATDDLRLLHELRDALTGILDPSHLIYRSNVLRSNSSLNPGFHAPDLNLHGNKNLAHDVLLDVLLLSRCDFLLKSISAVSEFALYWNPKLHVNSYDVQLRGQPMPKWADGDTKCEKKAAAHAPHKGNGNAKREERKEPRRRHHPSPPPPIPAYATAKAVEHWHPTPDSTPGKKDGCPRQWVDPNRDKPMQMKTLAVVGVLPTARLLGVALHGKISPKSAEPLVELPKEGECVAKGEQGAFASQCGSTIRQMNRLLSELRYRRGLFFEFSGRSVWGLGHVLSLAYTLHYTCRRLRRYCYLRLWDSQLDDLFGYANGERWAPLEDELSKYKEVVTIDMHKESGSNISNVYERLTNESASLIHIKLIMSTPLIASESMPWTMPL